MLDIESQIKLLAIAYRAALNSPDPSCQNGAVLARLDDDLGHKNQVILAEGYSHFYDGVEPEVKDREKRLQRIEHAERDVIFKAAKYGFRTEGTIMVCPWAPCRECARAVLGAGINTLITHRPRCKLTPKSWASQVNEALLWLFCGGIEIAQIDEPIPGTKPILVNGRLWSPETLKFVGEE